MVAQVVADSPDSTTGPAEGAATPQNEFQNLNCVGLIVRRTQSAQEGAT